MRGRESEAIVKVTKSKIQVIFLSLFLSPIFIFHWTTFVRRTHMDKLLFSGLFFHSFSMLILIESKKLVCAQHKNEWTEEVYERKCFFGRYVCVHEWRTFLYAFAVRWKKNKGKGR